MARGSDSPFGKKRSGSNPEELSAGNQTIMSCIEAGLGHTLGESAQAATLFFVESLGGPKPEEIPGNPQGFCEAMRKIFGRGSAELLKAILRELRSKEAAAQGGTPLRDFASVIERALKSMEKGVA